MIDAREEPITTVFENTNQLSQDIGAMIFGHAVSQKSRLRFTADNGTIYYGDLFFDGTKREGSAAPSGTEFIHNANARIEAMAKVIGGGPDDIQVWVEVQEI